MNGPIRGRQGDLLARQEWTERLRRFAGARSAEARQQVIEPALKVSPGGALRDMLRAYGYSSSARGRKPKGSLSDGTARERLEAALGDLFGRATTPVPSLYAKLSGRVDTSVMDAVRIVAALVYSWPEQLERGRGARFKDPKSLMEFAESFMRELLAEVSSGRSRSWSETELEDLVFRLADEKRVGITQFINTAGKEEGALIVAGAKRILVGGDDSVSVMRQFHSLTSQFVGKDHQGLLIFVFNSSLFEAGREGFNLLYNQGLLTAAIMGFALFPESYAYSDPIQEHSVDWERWRTLTQRCCVVLRKPPFVDPTTGRLRKLRNFDEFIGSWQLKQKFESLEEVEGFFRFETGHVLPRTYPSMFGESLRGSSLYWDVRVRPRLSQADGLEVQYYIPPNQDAALPGELTYTEGRPSRMHRSRGRPTPKPSVVEEDYFYLIQLDSPGAPYDDAQRAIYRAARGRLNLDQGETHKRNLNAAAALRQVGFEVFPISVLLSLFPRMLESAASMPK